MMSTHLKMWQPQDYGYTLQQKVNPLGKQIYSILQKMRK